jgi:hypothetical protein
MATIPRHVIGSDFSRLQHFKVHTACWLWKDLTIIQCSVLNSWYNVAWFVLAVNVLRWQCFVSKKHNKFLLKTQKEAWNSKPCLFASHTHARAHEHTHTQIHIHIHIVQYSLLLHNWTKPCTIFGWTTESVCLHF